MPASTPGCTPHLPEGGDPKAQRQEPDPAELLAEPGLKPGFSLPPELQGSPNCIMSLNETKGNDLGKQMGRACNCGEVKVVSFVFQGSWLHSRAVTRQLRDSGPATSPL